MFDLKALTAHYPKPWSIDGAGDVTNVVDGDGMIVFSVPWDGVDNGEGGINDKLDALTDAFNRDAS